MPAPVTLLVMTRRSKIRFLDKVPLFEGLSEEQLELIADLALTRSYQTGEDITSEGQEGEEFFLIERGSVAVTQKGSAIAELGAGDHFGELSLLDRIPRTATVTAKEPTDVILLRRRAFMTLLGRTPEMAIRLLQTAAQRIRMLSEDSAEL